MIRLTIGMLVYNDKLFLSESIENILNQSYKDFTLILSDDSSSDGSKEICEKYSALDNRIRYIRHETNNGISKNMKFLLSKAESEYFMWAADDDKWDKNYIQNLIELLDNNPDAICAFSSFALIDENNIQISGTLNYNYSDSKKIERLSKLILQPNDTFGYGIFRRKEITEVEFPIWWWPNRIDPYNNIYPSLCYYLAKGNFANLESEPLFFNRIKSVEKINHRQPYAPDSLKSFLAFSLRKFNLIFFSTKMIRKSAGVDLALATYPMLFQHWFIKPVILQFKDYLKKKMNRAK